MPAGIKYGGRQKGSPNKKTIMRQKAQEEASQRLKELIGADQFPGDAVDLFQAVYKDLAMPLPTRLEAARLAAPYERVKLQHQLKAIVDATPEVVIQHFFRHLPPPSQDEITAESVLQKASGDKSAIPDLVVAKPTGNDD